VLQLPILINGEVRETSSDGFYTVSYESGLEVSIPKPTRADIEELRRATNEELFRMPIDDILVFLSEVGKRWADPSFHLREEAQRHAVEITGYNERIVGYDHFVVSAGLSRAKLYRFLENDLGDGYLLDEWRPVQAVYRRVIPRGKAVHVMVGNVPMAALFTIVRSVITKNLTIAKLPQRDLVTSLYFALACHDLDPDHPVTKSLSVLYWEGGSALEDDFLGLGDVVCVWGQKPAIEGIKRKLRYGQELIEFGPRRSLHMIGRDTPDWSYAGMKAAYDMSVYDQEACFSPLVAFVEKPVEPFVESIQPWLDHFVDRLPKGLESDDVRAHVTQKRMEAKLDGHRVIESPDGTDWTLIVADRPCEVPEHPLNRTLYVFGVDDLSDAYDWLGRDLQTVTIHPFDRHVDVATELARRGADRIVDLGRAGRPRPGFSHDGMLPLAKMVRWVSIERPLSFKYEFVSEDPQIDDEVLYGWDGEPKDVRPYHFRPASSAYSFAGQIR
jgi:long-chain-fatty-acyl-CoA reductase